jgi:hypothetical protein
MSWSLEPSTKGTLRVTNTGRIVERDLLPQIQEIVTAIQRDRLSGLLVDNREAVLDIPVATLSSLPEVFEAEGLPRSLKIAIVMPSDPRSVEKVRFFDDLATNHGYHVKLFAESHRATQWLVRLSF